MHWNNEFIYVKPADWIHGASSSWWPTELVWSEVSWVKAARLAQSQQQWGVWPWLQDIPKRLRKSRGVPESSSAYGNRCRAVSERHPGQWETPRSISLCQGRHLCEAACGHLLCTICANLHFSPAKLELVGNFLQAVLDRKCWFAERELNGPEMPVYVRWTLFPCHREMSAGHSVPALSHVCRYSEVVCSSLL